MVQEDSAEGAKVVHVKVEPSKKHNVGVTSHPPPVARVFSRILTTARARTRQHTGLHVRGEGAEQGRAPVRMCTG